MRAIDLSFNANPHLSDPGKTLDLHRQGYGYLSAANNYFEISVIAHLDYEGSMQKDEIHYQFFRRPNRFLQIPWKTMFYLKKEKPVFVVSQGMIFPLQNIALKILTGKSTRLIVQHHGERPAKGIRLGFQKLADRFIDGYLFTAKGNSDEWISKKIICSTDKCHEVLEASTFIQPMDRDIAHQQLDLKGNLNFLWVGRLNANKDPLFALDVFESFASEHPGAQLYMIFQENDLLELVKRKMLDSKILRSSVHLLGKMDHDELVKWYSACDFYISCSHSEGSGYALLEAIACGCIPVVSDIPSFRKITGEGTIGFLFPPGNKQIASTQMAAATKTDATLFRERMKRYFEENLTFEAIARQLARIIGAEPK